LSWILQPAQAQATRPATAAPRPAQVTPTNAAAADAQFAKAKSLYDQQRFSEAQVENEKALQIDPSNKDALLLRRVLADKLASGGTSSSGISTPVAAGKPNVLNAQQIAMIRVLELKPNERPFGKIDRKVLDDFWSEVILTDPLTSDKS